MSNKPPVVFDDDNPEWTAEDFARAKRGADIPAVLQTAFGKRPRGRPAGSGTTEKITIRLDREVLAKFRAGGQGWQTRINEVLKRSA